LAPSGLAIKFRKRIWSSGTPLDIRTSTAIRAEPPRRKVSTTRAIDSGQQTSGEHWIEQKHPSICNVLR
jgi:hypothetical protein